MFSQNILKTRQNISTVHESERKNSSYQTGLLLSPKETLNTGVLYTFGSKLSNVTLAPTLFLMGESSSFHYIKATTQFSSQSSQTYSDSVRSHSLVHSSDSHFSKNVSSSQQTKNSRNASKSETSSKGHSRHSQTTTLTDRLTSAVATINTSPIQVASKVSSQSRLWQGLATESTWLSSSSPWKPDTKLSSSKNPESEKSEKLRTSKADYISTTQRVHSHFIPVSSERHRTSETFQVTTTMEFSEFSMSNSEKVTTMFSKAPFNRTRNFIIESTHKVSSQTSHGTVDKPSTLAEQKSQTNLSKTMIETSDSWIYRTTSLDLTQTFKPSPSSAVQESTLSIQESSSESTESRYEITLSRESKSIYVSLILSSESFKEKANYSVDTVPTHSETSVQKPNVTSHSFNKTLTSMVSTHSKTLDYRTKTSSFPQKSGHISQPTSSSEHFAKTSSQIFSRITSELPLASSKTNCKNTAAGCAGNSASSVCLAITSVILIVVSFIMTVNLNYLFD